MPEPLAVASGLAVGPPQPVLPTQQPAAQAIAERASIVPPQGYYGGALHVNVTPPRAPLLPEPEEEPEPIETVTSAETRREYARGLLNGQVKGPQDFSEGYTAAALQATREHIEAPTAPSDADTQAHVAQATTAARGLASKLPTQEDLIDHSIALARDAGYQLTPEIVSAIKSNLAETWAETGKPPAQLYAESRSNAALKDFLTTPQRTPEPPAPRGEPTEMPAEAHLWLGDPEGTMAARASTMMQPAVEAYVKSRLDEIRKNGQNLVNLRTREIAAMQRAVASGKSPLASTLLGDEADPQLGKDRQEQALEILMGFGVNSVASQAIKNLFLTPDQQRARALNKVSRNFTQATIRKERGNSVGDHEIAKAQLEQYRRAVNKEMPAYEEWVRQGNGRSLLNKPAIAHLLDYIEGRSANVPLDPSAAPFAPLADALRDIHEEMRLTIEAEFPSAGFIEDYYRHMWVDTRSLWDVLRGSGRQGSGASMSKRSIPTIADGLAQGLIPKIMDPIDNSLHYIQGMRDFIAAHRVIEAMKGQGYIAVSPSRPAKGMTKLDGRGSDVAVAAGVTQHMWAPAGAARSYNYWVGKGFYDWPGGGPVYDKILFAANMMTAMKLSLSGFHAWNIAQESAVGTFTKAVGEITRGDLIEGVKDLALSPLTVPGRIVASTIPGKLGEKLPEPLSTGVRFQRQYLGLQDYGPDMSRLVQIFRDSGGAAVGRGREYRIGMSQNFFQAWRRGALNQELRRDLRSVLGNPATETAATRAVMSPLRAIGVVMQETGRLMDTVMAPLFDHTIPIIKNAAWADEMEAWLRMNPRASQDTIENMGRKLVDSMDNRFGEMIQDNLFWPRMIKQALNVLTVSVGWEYGSLRAFGLAGKDAFQKEVLAIKARWFVGFAMQTALQASIYSYLMTGHGPQTAKEFVTPKSGGFTPQGKPETVLMPGYAKDALAIGDAFWKITQLDQGAIPALTDYAASKGSPGVQLGRGFMTGKKWPYDDASPIVSRTHEHDPNIDPYWEKLRWAIGDYGKFVFEAIEPINLGTRKEEGTALGMHWYSPQRLLGLRPAPKYWSDPEGLAGAVEGHEKLLRGIEAGRIRRANDRLAQPDPSIPPPKKSDVVRGLGPSSAAPTAPPSPVTPTPGANPGARLTIPPQRSAPAPTAPPAAAGKGAFGEWLKQRKPQ